MPRGIVTQAVVERWLLRNGRLWVVQSSCSFGNLWFAANTAWKQTRIPVTWSSVLSARLPCMLNKRELVVRWATGIPLLQSLLECSRPRTLHSIQSCDQMVPNHRWDNWGWEMLGKTSLEEGPANDRLGSYFLVVERRVREDSSRHPTALITAAVKIAVKTEL